jgi:hypothetical protein
MEKTDGTISMREIYACKYLQHHSVRLANVPAHLKGSLVEHEDLVCRVWNMLPNSLRLKILRLDAFKENYIIIINMHLTATMTLATLGQVSQCVLSVLSFVALTEISLAVSGFYNLSLYRLKVRSN